MSFIAVCLRFGRIIFIQDFSIIIILSHPLYPALVFKLVPCICSNVNRFSEEQGHNEDISTSSIFFFHNWTKRVVFISLILTAIRHFLFFLSDFG